MESYVCKMQDATHFCVLYGISSFLVFVIPEDSCWEDGVKLCESFTPYVSDCVQHGSESLLKLISSENIQDWLVQCAWCTMSSLY